MKAKALFETQEGVSELRYPILSEPYARRERSAPRKRISRLDCCTSTFFSTHSK